MSDKRVSKPDRLFAAISFSVAFVVFWFAGLLLWLTFEVMWVFFVGVPMFTLMGIATLRAAYREWIGE